MKNEQNFETRYINARKKYITREFSSLNDMQQEAVLKTEGALLILAGAGSGKTTVLINKIANILKYGSASDCDEVPDWANERDLEILEAGEGEKAAELASYNKVRPWEIIAITFTNKAADELKSRLVDKLGDEANDIWARTFHSACVKILRRDADKLGYPNDFTIYDASDCQAVMKQILRDMNLDEKTFVPRTVLSKLDAARDELMGPMKYAQKYANSPDPRQRTMVQIYEEYTRRLFNAGAMDFEDLLYNTVRLLQDHIEVRERYQRQFKYVLIDEYQDTNNLQYLLASILADGWGNICVVGDDDQSIYKFRGATIENILNFEREYRNCTTIRLEQNYRSTGNILKASNAVIANNNERKGKELWTNSEMGEKLTMYASMNEDDEAQYIATRIMESYGKGGNFSDNAVLYRMNALSNRLEFQFKRNAVPYRVLGGMRFFDRAEIKDVLAYMCVVQAPQDDLRLQRIINTPTRGIGAKTIETIAEIARNENVSMSHVVSRANEYPELSKAAMKLIKFSDMMNDLREASKDMPLDIFYDFLLDKTGYIRALEEKGDENLGRIENVKELKSNIVSYAQNTEEASLAGFLDEIALYTDMDSYDKEADCVVMMTMHSSKGLEFPNVYLAGMEEGIFPSSRAVGEDSEMEEERRLCYVAMTRAKKKLYICCARQRMLFGRTSINKPSRFVEEIPADTISRGGILPSKAQQQGEPAANVNKVSQSKTMPAAKPKSPDANSLNLNIGDEVTHKAFGEGVLLSMKPMGNDALIEIAFKDSGNKKLMLRAASQHMTKKGG